MPRSLSLPFPQLPLFHNPSRTDLAHLTSSHTPFPTTRQRSHPPLSPSPPSSSPRSRPRHHSSARALPDLYTSLTALRSSPSYEAATRRRPFACPLEPVDLVLEVAEPHSLSPYAAGSSMLLYLTLTLSLCRFARTRLASQHPTSPLPLPLRSTPGSTYAHSTPTHLPCPQFSPPLTSSPSPGPRKPTRS